jgi:hypothetical protein
MSGAWTRDDRQAFAAAVQRLASGHTERLRHTTPCDTCWDTPADPAPVVTGRPDAVLCHGCWWQANMAGGPK